MAFMIGPLQETDVWTLQDKKKVDLLLALRTDGESKFLNKRSIQDIQTILKSHSSTSDLSFEIVDWWSRKNFFNESVESPIGPDFYYKMKNELNKNFDHIKNFKSSIALMSVWKVLITDRIHTSMDMDQGGHLQDKAEMRFDSAETLEEPIILAKKMLLYL